MLGWLRHKTPPITGRPNDGNDPQHHAEDRLGKLLDRLGNESHTAATIIEVREMPAPPLREPASGPAAETAPLPATESRQQYVAGVDPDDYQEALPLFRRAMAAVGGTAADDAGTLAAKIVDALRDRHGFTPDLLTDINPYLEQFVRDVHNGIVEIAADDAPVAGDAPAEANAAAAEAASESAATASESSTPEEPAAAATPEPVLAASESLTPAEPAAETMPETAPAASESIALAEPPIEEARDIAPPAPRRRKTAKGGAGDAATAAEEPAGGFPGMRVIAVCSQKGGAGKTTIAAHLAVRAGETGHGPAVLIDTDPQGSLGEWWSARHADSPALAKVKLEDLAANLAELRSYGTAIAIIDTPPALTGSIEQVIAVADLVVIPARPSPHDLRAVGATVEMARRAGKPFLFVVNGAAPRASITAQAVAALSEHGRVVPVILYQRTDFAASMIDGRTVTETAASGNSAQEIARLWEYVYEQISMRVAA